MVISVAALAQAGDRVKRKARQPKEFKSPFKAKVNTMLHQFWFDALLGVMIMLNLVLVIIETDAGSRKEDPPAWTNVASRFIIIVFTIDLSLQLYVGGVSFFCDGMNIFDFAVVCTDVMFNLIELIAGPVLSVSILRIVRLCKLARVAKAFKIFSELRLLLAGLIGSVKAIFWGTVLLVLSLLIWSVIAVQFLHPLNEKIAETGVYGDCERCGRVYATVFDAFIVFFQQIVAGDSWGMVTITVIEKHPASMFIYGPIFLSVGLAVLNLMLGVVVDVASQARGYLVGQIEEESLMTKMELKHKLQDLCQALDKDGSGDLNKEELRQGVDENPEFQKSLSGMGITAADIDILFSILDEDNSGTVSYVEFCSYCYKMKASKEEFMLTYIKYYVTMIKADIVDEIDLVKRQIKTQDEQFEQMGREIYREEKVIEQQIDNQTAWINDTLASTEQEIERQIDQQVNRIEQDLSKQMKTAVKGEKDLAGTVDATRPQAQKKELQATVEEKATIANPQREMQQLVVNRDQIIYEVTESMNMRQGELLAAIEAMKNKLDYTFDKLISPGSSLLATPPSVVPSERALCSQLMCASSRSCLARPNHAKVLTLPAERPGIP